MSPLFRRSLSDAHLALLSLFLSPRRLDNKTWQQQWTRALNHPYGKAVKDYIKRGLLTQPSTEQRISSGYRVSDLKPILKRHGLKVSGRKAELVGRLVEAEPAEAKRLAAEVECFVCTESGAELGQGWKDRTAERREEAGRQVRAALKRGQARKAGQAADRFRDSLPPPMDGRYSVGVSAGSGDGPRGPGANVAGAETVLGIKSVPGMSKEDIAAARLKAAEDVIWGRRFDVPGAFEATAYTELFKQSNQAYLRDLGRSHIEMVNVSAVQDSCESCGQLAANGPYPIKKAPRVPNPNCSHPIGWCRCCYTAHFG